MDPFPWKINSETIIIMGPEGKSTLLVSVEEAMSLTQNYHYQIFENDGAMGGKTNSEFVDS